jgi:hypothetical protein
MSTYIKWTPREFLNRLDVTMADQLQKSAEYTMNMVKEETPVKTGNLRNSIAQKTDKDTLVATVYSDVEYALYVEYGTRRFGPRAMFRKGLNRARYMIKKIFNTPLAMIGGNPSDYSWRS